ncbi:hypothetical protein HK101_003363 [Irineochytrium annulatum]|nr:hypothetical protein HK101_003363 [Irineochytrium annulatum]
MASFDASGDEVMLDEAILLFEASIAGEGSDYALLEEVKNKAWYKALTNELECATETPFQKPPVTEKATSRAAVVKKTAPLKIAPVKAPAVKEKAKPAVTKAPPAKPGNIMQTKAAPVKSKAGSIASLKNSPYASKTFLHAKGSKGSKSQLSSSVEKLASQPNKVAVAWSSSARLGLGRARMKKLKKLEDDKFSSVESKLELAMAIVKIFRDAIAIENGCHDAYIDLGGLLEKYVSTKDAADLFASFPFASLDVPPAEGDLYLYGELTRLLMKSKCYKEPALERAIIAQGRAYGMGTMAKNVEILDSAGESKVLMRIYAAVNRKSVEDSEMQAFFKSKYWV